MLNYRYRAKGSFRSGQLELLAPAGSPGRGEQRKGGRDSDQPRRPTDPRRDPAFHNRVLFAGADR